MIGTNFGIYRPSANQHANQQAPPPTAPNAEEQKAQVQQISDFLLQLEDYVPSVPDAVSAHYLNSAGFDTNDPRIVRLISVATQKFIADVAHDALQHCKSRRHNMQEAKSQYGIKGQNKPNKDRRYTLNMEDLNPALDDFGLTARKANYYQ